MLHLLVFATVRWEEAREEAFDYLIGTPHVRVGSASNESLCANDQYSIYVTYNV
jgi:hypothetical protein